MKKILISILLAVIAIGMLVILTGCNSEKNNKEIVDIESDNETQKGMNTNNLKTDYLKSDNGTRIEFYIPNGFEETDFYNKSDKWKGYNNGSATIDLQIITKERADSIKNRLLQQNYKEEEYTVNNKTYNKIYSIVDGKEAAVTYLYKINDETYYSVSDFRKTLTDNQINTFLTIKD